MKKNSSVQYLNWVWLVGLLCAIAIMINFTTLSSFFLSHFRIDSTGHFIGFFSLTALLLFGLKLPVFSTSFTLVVYAIATELGQAYLGFRNGELNDVIADIYGMLSAIICFYIAQYVKKKWL